MFEDIEASGGKAMEKYWNDTELMTKIAARMQSVSLDGPATPPPEAGRAKKVSLGALLGLWSVRVSHAQKGYEDLEGPQGTDCSGRHASSKVMGTVAPRKFARLSPAGGVVHCSTGEGVQCKLLFQQWLRSAEGPMPHACASAFARHIPCAQACSMAVLFWAGPICASPVA